MSNKLLNDFRVTAPDRETLDAVLDEFYCLEVAGERTNFFPDENGKFACHFEFKTAWSPPIEAYKKIEENVSKIGKADIELDATWVDEGDHYDIRYRWLFDGVKYEVVKTGLTYSPEDIAKYEADEADRAAENLLVKRVAEMRQERDDLTIAIRILEKRYLESELPF